MPKPKKPTAKKPSGTRLSWPTFAAFDRALTPELVASQLVGASLFPDLPANYDGFTAEVEADPPATHEVHVGEAGDKNYEVTYHQTVANEDYKDHGKATFKAVADAIAALHGKAATSSAKHRSWEVDGTEIRINLWFACGDPYGAKVELRVRPL